MPRSRKPNRGSRKPLAAPPVAEAGPVPPLLRDPWALAVALSVFAVIFAARGAPMGQPFLDDFLFLDFSVLRGNPSWWDGGGGLAYWRPLARQAYFSLFGPLMLSHPWVVAALHALVLAGAGVMLHRALRRALPGPAAAVAASFPLLIEGSRTLVAWASAAQDLGALGFLALTLFAVARGNAWLAAVAAVAAALCKEVAAPLALLAAFAPFPRDRGSFRAGRAAVAAAIGAWAIARFALPHFGGGAGVTMLAPPLSATDHVAGRLVRAVTLGARDGFSMDGAPLWMAGAAVLVALAPPLLARGRHLHEAGRWTAWGIAWFLLGVAPLSLFLPDWAAFRCVVPAFGLGVALVAPLALARAAWLLPLVAARFATLLFAQQPPATIPIDASTAGDIFSFPRLAEMQRAVREVRGTLLAATPTLKPGDRVMKEGFPRMSAVAFEGNRSLHAWYRDTTLRWVGREGIDGPPSDRARVLVEFEPHRVPQFAAVPESAILLTADMFTEVRKSRWPEALQLLERAESQVHDTTAARFRANLSGWRANCLFQMGRLSEAEEQAGIAMGHWTDTPNGRLILAEVKLVRGDPRGAVALLQQHVAIYPHDQDAIQALAEARRRAGDLQGKLLR